MRIRRKSNTTRGFHFRMRELACAILGNNLRRPFYARLVSSFALSTFQCKATLCLFFFKTLSLSTSSGMPSLVPSGRVLPFSSPFFVSFSSASLAAVFFPSFSRWPLFSARKAAHSGRVGRVDNAQNAGSRAVTTRNNRDHEAIPISAFSYKDTAGVIVPRDGDHFSRLISPSPPPPPGASVFEIAVDFLVSSSTTTCSLTASLPALTT